MMALMPQNWLKAINRMAMIKGRRKRAWNNSRKPPSSWASTERTAEISVSAWAGPPMLSRIRRAAGS